MLDTCQASARERKRSVAAKIGAVGAAAAVQVEFVATLCMRVRALPTRDPFGSAREKARHRKGLCLDREKLSGDFFVLVADEGDSDRVDQNGERDQCKYQCVTGAVDSLLRRTIDLEPITHSGGCQA